MAEVWGIVLAAGTSSRLGRPKQLLDIGGEPALNHVLRAAAMSSLEGTVLVLGHDADRIAGTVGDFGQVPVLNRDYRDGQSTSLRAGLRALPKTAAAAVILLGDQPLIDAPLIDAVVGGWADGADPERIVQARYGDTPAPPVLLGRYWFPDIDALTGDHGARELLRSRQDRVVMVQADRLPLLDLDTEADYARLRLHLGDSPEKR